MPSARGHLVLAAAFLVCMAQSVDAGDERSDASAEGTEAYDRVPRRFVTKHVGTFNGRRIEYTAVLQETILTDDLGVPAASVFTFSYLQDGTHAARRPVIFAFNGGPGASSTSLHMGALGPYRVDLPGSPPLRSAAPFSIVANEFSPLDVADLVFIDPVETGFSRVLAGGRASDYLGVREDAVEFARVIRHWLTVNGRWNSPKFILGESYGTIRAAALSRELMGSESSGAFNAVTLNGILLYASTLNPAQRQVVEGNDIAFQLFLPTMAATAWYHGKVDKSEISQDSFLAHVEEYAATRYATALFRGDTLSTADKERVASELSKLIGLDANFILEQDLRVTVPEFARALLAKEGLVVGIYDSRYTSPAITGADPVTDDPGMAQQSPLVVAALHDHLRRHLNVSVDDEYVYINFDVQRTWNWTISGGGNQYYRNYGPLLASALRQNPGLRVLVGSGLYDLAATFSLARYNFTHTHVPLDRVQIVTYASGHKPYSGTGALAAFVADIRKFVLSASQLPAQD